MRSCTGNTLLFQSEFSLVLDRLEKYCVVFSDMLIWMVLSVAKYVGATETIDDFV